MTIAGLKLKIKIYLLVAVYEIHYPYQCQTDNGDDENNRMRFGCTVSSAFDDHSDDTYCNYSDADPYDDMC